MRLWQRVRPKTRFMSIYIYICIVLSLSLKMVLEGLWVDEALGARPPFDRIYLSIYTHINFSSSEDGAERSLDG